VLKNVNAAVNIIQERQGSGLYRRICVIRIYPLCGIVAAKEIARRVRVRSFPCGRFNTVSSDNASAEACMMELVRFFFNGFKAGFSEYGKFMTDIVNYALLSIVYALGVGGTAVIARINGKRFLKLEKSTGKNTYWADYKNAKPDKEDYYRQF
jgi:hypothetical protein